MNKRGNLLTEVSEMAVGWLETECFRHGPGAHDDALRIVEQKLQAGYVHVVDADLKGYFDQSLNY